MNERIDESEPVSLARRRPPFFRVGVEPDTCANRQPPEINALAHLDREPHRVGIDVGEGVFHLFGGADKVDEFIGGKIGDGNAALTFQPLKSLCEDGVFHVLLMFECLNV